MKPSTHRRLRKDWRWPLYEHLAREHSLLCLDDELNNIIAAVHDSEKRRAKAIAPTVVKAVRKMAGPKVPKGYRLIDPEKDSPKRATDLFLIVSTWRAVGEPSPNFIVGDVYARRTRKARKPSQETKLIEKFDKLQNSKRQRESKLQLACKLQPPQGATLSELAPVFSEMPPRNIYYK